MGRVIGLVVAFVMVVAGVVWTLQGLDVLGDSSMSGQPFWAIVGPAVAGLGIALGIVVLTGGRGRGGVGRGGGGRR